MMLLYLQEQIGPAAASPIGDKRRQLRAFPLGMSRGVQSARSYFGHKPRELSKLDRLPHRAHSVKVEGQIVDGIQNLRQHLVGDIQMPQVRP
jgi:hypothetical protein